MCPRSKCRRGGSSADFNRNEKTGRLHAAKYNEFTVSACITFPSILNGGKLSQCLWDAVSEQVLPSQDEDVNYDNEGSDDAGEGDNNDGDPLTELQQPYAAPGGCTVGVGDGPNQERRSEDTRAGSQDGAVGGDAPPRGIDAGSSPTTSAGAAESSNADEQRIPAGAGDEPVGGGTSSKTMVEDNARSESASGKRARYRGREVPLMEAHSRPRQHGDNEQAWDRCGCILSRLLGRFLILCFALQLIPLHSPSGEYVKLFICSPSA